MKNKEKLILKFLKENGRSSTSRIGIAVSCSFWMVEKYLDKLNDKGLIIKEQKENATYWRLKEE